MKISGAPSLSLISSPSLSLSPIDSGSVDTFCSGSYVYAGVLRVFRVKRHRLTPFTSLFSLSLFFLRTFILSTSFDTLSVIASSIPSVVIHDYQNDLFSENCHHFLIPISTLQLSFDSYFTNIQVSWK